MSNLTEATITKINESTEEKIMSTAKSTVINKDAIERKLANFYNEIVDTNDTNVLPEEIIRNLFIKVNKLAVYTDFGIWMGESHHDSDTDMDYAHDSQMAVLLSNLLFDRFSIMPTTAYIVHGKHGLILEWIPTKPLYVQSFDEYLKLYQSFIDYIENDSVRPDDWAMNELENANYMVRYSALYSDMNGIDIEAPAEITTPLFIADNFKSPYLTIITNEGCFIE